MGRIANVLNTVMARFGYVPATAAAALPARTSYSEYVVGSGYALSSPDGAIDSFPFRNRISAVHGRFHHPYTGASGTVISALELMLFTAHHVLFDVENEVQVTGALALLTRGFPDHGSVIDGVREQMQISALQQATGLTVSYLDGVSHTGERLTDLRFTVEGMRLVAERLLEVPGMVAWSIYGDNVYPPPLSVTDNAPQAWLQFLRTLNEGYFSDLHIKYMDGEMSPHRE